MANLRPLVEKQSAWRLFRAAGTWRRTWLTDDGCLRTRSVVLPRVGVLTLPGPLTSAEAASLRLAWEANDRGRPKINVVA